MVVKSNERSTQSHLDCQTIHNAKLPGKRNVEETTLSVESKEMHKIASIITAEANNIVTVSFNLVLEQTISNLTAGTAWHIKYLLDHSRRAMITRIMSVNGIANTRSRTSQQ